MSHIKVKIEERVGVMDLDQNPRWDPHNWQVAVHIQKPSHRYSMFFQITPTPESYIDSTEGHTFQ